jgi:hypothetical protein
MLDFKKASKILEDHFANLTDEEFITNLKEYCPRVFDKDEISDEAEQRSAVLETITNLRSQQPSFKTPEDVDIESLKKNQHGQNEYDIS